MPEGLSVSSTTDQLSVVEAVAAGDEQAARSAAPQPQVERLDGSSAVAFEHPKSERRMLMQRLAAHEADLADLSAPEPEAETVSNEVEPEPYGEAAAEAAGVDDESKLGLDIDAVRRAAIADAIEDGRRRFRQPYQEAEQIREQMAVAFAARLDEIKRAGIEKLAQDAVKNGPDISVAVRDALLGLRGGPEALIHLIEHPEMRRQLARDDDYVAVARVGELAGRLAGPPKRQRSSAPAPIAPVGGSATRSSVSMDQLSYSDYRAAREREIKSRRGR